MNEEFCILVIQSLNAWQFEPIIFFFLNILYHSVSSSDLTHYKQNITISICWLQYFPVALLSIKTNSELYE